MTRMRLIGPWLLVAALALGCNRGRSDSHSAAPAAPQADESARKQAALTEGEPAAGAGGAAPGTVSPEAARAARRSTEEESEESHHPFHGLSGDVLADYCDGCAIRVCGIAYTSCSQRPACADCLRGRGCDTSAPGLAAAYRAACDCLKKCANCAAKVSCP